MGGGPWRRRSAWRTNARLRGRGVEVERPCVATGHRDFFHRGDATALFLSTVTIPYLNIRVHRCDCLVGDEYVQTYVGKHLQSCNNLFFR